MPVNADFDESIQSGPVGSNTLLLQTRYPVVAASRVRLRPFTLVDIAGLISAVAAHRIADTTLSVPRPFDARQARQWIEGHPLEWRRRCAIHWAVSGLDHDRMAGYVGLHDIRLQLGRATLSFWIVDRLARRELAIEAAQAGLEFAFSSLQLESVHSHLLDGNPLMARILRRLGMKSDTATLQTQSRWGRSEEVSHWSLSRATWKASLRDPAAH
ncbi:MAG TPA: GNAT family N-acetyltransferase [Steroidobacteraceae bacterium]|jgi:RimJ/RimL family protein N-acetyltransferase